MKARVNREILTQTTFDSAAPHGLACVAHPFDEEGDLEIRVRSRDGATVEVAPLTVAPAERPEAAARAQKQQAPPSVEAPPAPQACVDLDPTALRRRGSHARVSGRHHLQRGGFLRVSASRASDGATVSVHDVASGECKFDCSVLDRGDIFAVTLIRPGDYMLLNERTGHRTVVRVAYPKRGATPYRPPKPLELTCDEGGFGGGEVIDLSPAQGLVVRPSAPSRFRLELTKPDDGPGEEPDPKKKQQRDKAKQLLRKYRKVRRGGT